MNESLIKHIIKETVFNYSRTNYGQYRLDINVKKNYILGNYIIYRNRRIKFSARVYYHYYIYLGIDEYSERSERNE